MQAISTIDDKPDHTSAFQYLEKNNTQRQVRMCAQRCFICKEIGVKLEKSHCYEYVPKLSRQIHGRKVTTLRNEKLKRDRTITSDNEK
jgi:hypothetical protein